MAEMKAGQELDRAIAEAIDDSTVHRWESSVIVPYFLWMTGGG